MEHKVRDITVTETGKGKFQNQIEIGKHHFLASEPTELGGDDSGPTPIELLNAALGACTSITLRMYADRKGWPLEGVWVNVTHQRGVIEECEDLDVAPSKPRDVFTKIIKLKGPLDSAQQARLLEIAEKCPVHRILKQSACMRSRLDT